MFFGWIFPIFYQNCQNLAFRLPAGYLRSVQSISVIFLKFINFLRSWVLSHSATCITAHIFTFWWKLSSSRSLAVKVNFERIHKYIVQVCLNNFFLVFSSLNRHGNSKNDQFLVGKSKTSSYAFSTKFVLYAKVKIVLFEIYQI